MPPCVSLLLSRCKPQAERNCLTRTSVSSGFSSGKKCPPFIACPSACGAHCRQIPGAPVLSVEKSQAGHPGPTEATLGIRFACRLPYRRYRVRRRSLFFQHQHGRESTAKLEPWAQASRGRYVVDLIVAVDPAITPSEAGMRGPTVRN